MKRDTVLKVHLHLMTWRAPCVFSYRHLCDARACEIENLGHGSYTQTLVPVAATQKP